MTVRLAKSKENSQPRVKPLVVSLQQNRDQLLRLLRGLDAVWLDINADFVDVGANIGAVIIDLPLSVTGFTERLTALLDRLPRDVARLFVIDRKNRLEVVRANVLGATMLGNRPLSEHEVQDFFTSQDMPPPTRNDAGAASIKLASGALGQIFDNVLAGRAIDFPAVEHVADEIASTLDDDGLETWLRTVRDHHQGTMQHCLIVAGVMTRFGQQLGMSANDVRMLTRIGLLHDVGKAKVPSALLDKPGKLTEDEFAVVKTHPYEGFKFLAEQKILSDLELAAVVGHHEYLDGSGYPKGLMDNSIGDLVRITTVCDIYGALVERRSYKREMSPEDAIALVNQMAGAGKVEAPLVRALHRSLD